MGKAELFNIITLQENLNPDLLNLYDRDVPHIIKYMGAKRKIIDFVIEAINETYEEGKFCDLFSGTSIL